jgi:hypothetical protein
MELLSAYADNGAQRGTRTDTMRPLLTRAATAVTLPYVQTGYDSSRRAGVHEALQGPLRASAQDLDAWHRNGRKSSRKLFRRLGEQAFQTTRAGLSKLQICRVAIAGPPGRGTSPVRVPRQRRISDPIAHQIVRIARSADRMTPDLRRDIGHFVGCAVAGADRCDPETSSPGLLDLFSRNQSALTCEAPANAVRPPGGPSPSSRRVYESAPTQWACAPPKAVLS